MKNSNNSLMFCRSQSRQEHQTSTSDRIYTDRISSSWCWDVSVTCQDWTSSRVGTGSSEELSLNHTSKTAASHVHQSSRQIIDKPEPLFGDLTWSIRGVQRSLTPLRPPTNKQLCFLWNLPEATSPVMSPKKNSSSQLKKNNRNSVH